MSLFNQNIKDTFVFHIPHSSTNIPFNTGFNVELMQNEIELLTDWATDKIFDVNEITKVVPQFSRIFCDVERLPDEQEEMFVKGRGFFYTHTDNGNVLRENINQIKEKIYNDYYLPHHKLFNQKVNSKLDKHNVVNIIDCHSFTDIPFESDLNKNTNRPDVCLGIDEFHTPKYLLNYIKNIFEKEKLTVGINNPYRGTIVPLEHYQKNNKVHSIMIEINRKLYMENNIVIDKKVNYLNKIINSIFHNF